MVEARGVDLLCGAGRVAAADPALRCPKNRSGLLRPSGFSTAAEIACCLALPPAAATRNSPGTPFTPAPVQLPMKVLPKAKSSRLTVRAFHFWICCTVLIEFPAGGAPPVQGGAFLFRGVQTAKGVHFEQSGCADKLVFDATDPLHIQQVQARYRNAPDHAACVRFDPFLFCWSIPAHLASLRS